MPNFPEDIRDILAVSAGFDEFGREITFDEMINANDAMVRWLEGGDSEVYFDALAQAGVDPIVHLSPIFNAVGR